MNNELYLATFSDERLLNPIEFDDFLACYNSCRPDSRVAMITILWWRCFRQVLVPLKTKGLMHAKSVELQSLYASTKWIWIISTMLLKVSTVIFLILVTVSGQSSQDIYPQFPSGLRQQHLKHEPSDLCSETQNVVQTVQNVVGYLKASYTLKQRCANFKESK
ncbi:hypothetical protein TNCV_945271 [Trichonephila clavipes]|nr:hypothetical protein TNCV_945271 [Trichonephila clavipes]